MIKALIVYTTLTGKTKAAAEIIQKRLQELGVSVQLIESVHVGPEAYLDVDLCVLGTYTYGIDGQLPDEMVDFYEELLEVDLKGKTFGTFGSGDTFYEHFCQSVIDFNEQFKRAGAIEGSKSVLIDLDPDTEEDIQHLRDFAGNLVAALSEK